MSKLSADAIKMLSEGKNIATIATVMPDGSPQATVVWIDTDGEHVIFNTAEGRVKTENLRRDPRVAIAVTDADNPYEQVTIRGRVVEFTHDGADAHIDALAKKYLGMDEYPLRNPDEQRVIVKIAPA
ncbi:MAG: PPOX class F420-dependent oxidoreductase [Chloroflexi bacterium]|nr:PPOX class F420-dependent oxidoreductase [Chloroflexota bacterium]